MERAIDFLENKKSEQVKLAPTWSEWRDLNPRPLRPERSTLPNCATPRNIVTIVSKVKILKILYYSIHIKSRNFLEYLTLYYLSDIL